MPLVACTDVIDDSAIPFDDEAEANLSASNNAGSTISAPAVENVITADDGDAIEIGSATSESDEEAASSRVGQHPTSTTRLAAPEDPEPAIASHGDELTLTRFTTPPGELLIAIPLTWNISWKKICCVLHAQISMIYIKCHPKCEGHT
eukprot:COSAG06_NODE_1528_length_9183_cov_265.329811_2_plen_148_part_00